MATIENINAVKTLLNIESGDTSFDTLISLYMDIAAEQIMNSCNIDTLPLRAELSILIPMTVLSVSQNERYIDLVKSRYDPQITGLTEFSRTVNFTTVQPVDMNTAIEHAIKTFSKQLGTFRRIGTLRRVNT